MGLTDYLGKKRRLMIVKEVEFGVYLGNKDDKVLLPKKQVPKDVEVGDPVEVFLYKDSSDRLIATTQEPKITLDELAVLKVADTGRIGAFLDWGLEKDLLLPFKEQTAKVKKGDEHSSNPPWAPIFKKQSASVHTHGAYDPKYESDQFSEEDLKYSFNKGVSIYVATPS